MLSTRRPLFQCLHAPARRHASNVPRGDIHAILRHTHRRGLRPELDSVSTHRANLIEIARLKKRRNWLALGAALSMIAPIFLVRLWDLPEEPKDTPPDPTASRGIVDMVLGPPTKTDAPRAAAEQFQGKRVVVAAGDKVIAAPADATNPQATDADAVELVPVASTHIPYFPRTIRVPTTAPDGTVTDQEYTLLGLGPRRVSFLRVQVYILGLYISTASLPALQTALIHAVNPRASALIPSEKDALRSALLDPTTSIALWDALLADPNVHMAFRVVPTRNTDFKHLQDGWMRGVAGRTDEVRRRQQLLLQQQAVEKKTISLPKPVQESEFADDAFGAAMKDFKALFTGRGKAAKGSVILLTRDGRGELGAWFQPTAAAKGGEGAMGELVSLGTVRDPRVSRLVWQMYLGGEAVSSEDARKSVAEGCLGVAGRPVGSVEGMVV
ncbi:chalcone-flavanone isomerase-domain-containing protein [Boeremia exigua]|uniref:chalcone-flavanone isomerase-domain-containing protein n=1 Tax=Boeremia exigua TaxID=749465 RepID=UPI001E8CE5D3|nr:chalcone-flavanone isomerase-domain-containing protein [Boeremia exigua]KAH6633769.1 chalcone-flavanone isomerase-domain-containing protein [Boeremia exigua]